MSSSKARRGSPARALSASGCARVRGREHLSLENTNTPETVLADRNDSALVSSHPGLPGASEFERAQVQLLPAVFFLPRSTPSLPARSRRWPVPTFWVWGHSDPPCSCLEFLEKSCPRPLILLAHLPQITERTVHPSDTLHGYPAGPHVPVQKRAGLPFPCNWQPLDRLQATVPQCRQHSQDRRLPIS